MAQNKKKSATNTGNSGTGNNTGNANTGTTQPGSSTSLWSSINNVLQNLPAGATQQQISQAIANNVGPAASAIQAKQVAKNAKNQPNTSGTRTAGSGGAGMGVYNDIIKYMDNNGLSYFSGSVPDTEKQKMLDESWKMQDTAGRQWVNDVNTNLINRVNNEMDKLDKKALGQVEGTAEQKWKQDGLGEADTLIGETGTLSLAAPKYSPLGYIPPKREIADNKNIQLTREQEKQPRSHSGSGGGNQQPQYFGYSTLGIDSGKHQIVGIAAGNSTHNGLGNLWERAFKKGESFDKLAGEAKTALQPNLKKGLDPLFTQQYDFISRSFDPKTKQWSEKKEKLALPQVLEKTMVAISDSMGLTSRVSDKVTDAILKQNAKFPIVVDASGNTYINKYYLQSSQGNRDQLQLIASGAINNLMGQQTTTGLQHMTDAMKKNNEAITRQILKSNLNPRTGLTAGEYHYIFTDVMMTSLAEALTQARNGKLTIRSATK